MPFATYPPDSLTNCPGKKSLTSSAPMSYAFRRKFRLRQAARTFAGFRKMQEGEDGKMQKRIAAGVLIAALAAAALAGCAAGKLLEWRRLDYAAAAGAERKWNAYRFETFGPFPEQRVGYILFSDDARVDVWQAPRTDLGKMSLRDIAADHERYLRSRMWTGTALAVNEIWRDGKAIAYTAAEFEMDVYVWEMPPSGPKVDLQLVVIDRRSFSGGGGNSFDSTSGD